MRKQLIASGLVVAAIVIVMVAQAAPASASHFTHWILIRAPFSGYWDRFGIAHPSYHQTHFGGDWGVDFYQLPGTGGTFFIANSNGLSSYGVVGSRGGTCRQGLWAGYAYRFDLYDSTGYRGWYLTAHVSETNGMGQSYLLQPGSYMYNGNFIGWTAQYPNSDCYQVDTASGVHWHIEAYQPSHYACYFPYSSGTYLSAGQDMGAVGSNATYAKAPCW
jgi:hypothetical protein